MQDEIEDKLIKFLENHRTFTEECHVIYFLVESRKILDHERSKGMPQNYPLLRFYADWAVHTDKDQISPQIRRTMEAIYQEVLAERRRDDSDFHLFGFNFMVLLSREMRPFFVDHGLPTGILELAGWQAFNRLLTSILVDQPIKKPCPGIRKFSYKAHRDGGAVEIEYVKPSGEVETVTRDPF